MSDRGSIPAGAGEPHWHSIIAAIVEVYPRGCGGADGDAFKACPAKGLSPRVRGSLIFDDVGDAQSGSIPAGAGEP